MTTKRTPSKPKKPSPDCTICLGRGWYYAGHAHSPWPHECFRCFPPHAQVKGTPTKGAAP